MLCKKEDKEKLQFDFAAGVEIVNPFDVNTEAKVTLPGRTPMLTGKLRPQFEDLGVSFEDFNLPWGDNTMKAIEQKSGKRKAVVEPLTPGGESADSPAPKKKTTPRKMATGSPIHANRVSAALRTRFIGQVSSRKKAMEVFGGQASGFSWSPVGVQAAV